MCGPLQIKPYSVPKDFASSEFGYHIHFLNFIAASSGHRTPTVEVGSRFKDWGRCGRLKTEVVD